MGCEQMGCTKGADGGGADGGGDVVVGRGDVSGERAERVEGRLTAPVQLLLHVLRDLVQRHMPRALVHHLRTLCHTIGEAARGVSMNIVSSNSPKGARGALRLRDSHHTGPASTCMPCRRAAAA